MQGFFLPEFDYLCLHGIWSWNSETNGVIIVDFIRRKLKVGGLLYKWACLANHLDDFDAVNVNAERFQRRLDRQRHLLAGLACAARRGRGGGVECEDDKADERFGVKLNGVRWCEAVEEVRIGRVW